MSAETSIDYNDGCLQTLTDLDQFAKTNLSVSEYKKLRDQFIAPKMQSHTAHLTRIMSEMAEAYKQK